MIETRELTADDWPVWRSLRLAALADAPDAFGARLADWQGDGDREERWRARLSITGSVDLVAVVDGKPAGMASGVPGPEQGVVELISLWVGPGARGRGVGDHLVRAVEDWARRGGAEVLRLKVVPDNAPAIALYRRNGLKVTGRRGEAGPGGRGEHVMAKRLPGRAP
ncbi:GNAT family N-acetyltransferase [Streptomyces triculaminicus]|uniref:GNAT family N-acetyltransferase n=1 Tax=Streptomyces triculaminicus TaxID=2816232 RepID=UPI0037D723CA